LAFLTQRSAGGVDFVGTPGFDVLVAFNEPQSPPSAVSGFVRANGGAAADTMTFFEAFGVLRNASVNGNDGADAISINTSLADSSLNGNKGTDTINIFGNISSSFVGGGAGNDVLLGNNQVIGVIASRIEGGSGDDTIWAEGNMSQAEIRAGDDNDTINLVGDAGEFWSQTQINGNAGNDVINASLGAVAPGGANALVASIDFNTVFIGGGGGDDTFNFQFALNGIGGNLGFKLEGGTGNDLFNTSTQNDTTLGSDGNDTVIGNTGNDQITGGGGADIYAGVDPGNDTYFIKALSDSAAATSGTAKTFDQFVTAGSFQTLVDKLDLKAVSSQLTGAPITPGAVATVSAGVVLPGTFADFAALQTTLTSLGAPASTPNNVLGYQFTAGGAIAGTYLWIQDNQSAYTSGDLLFGITAFNQILGGDILVV
jgi:Ca2+-binding RTX toxin-like protein